MRWRRRSIGHRRPIRKADERNPRAGELARQPGMARLNTISQASLRDGVRRPVQVPTRRWRLHYRRRIQLWGVSFVLPTLLFFAVFKYGPMVWAVELSFTSYDMVSPPRSLGLENFESLAADPIFRQSLFNTIVYIAGSTALITLVG